MNNEGICNIVGSDIKKDVAAEVNLNLSEFPEEKRISGMVALFANCDFMLREDRQGFGSEQGYWKYIEQCGNASVSGNRVKEGG